MLWDSPFLDAGEERQQEEEIPSGELIMPPPLDLDLLPFARPFYPMNVFPGPHHQEDPVREIAATPHINVEVSLEVRADTSTVLREVPYHQ